MEVWRLLRLKLPAVLLLRFISLLGGPAAGAERKLHCVNNYLSTITCSLSPFTPDGSSSYWLSFADKNNKQKLHVCELKEVGGKHFCSVEIHAEPGYVDMFDDTDEYVVSLCGGGAQRCEVLIEDYRVDSNIKPNAPCCLTLSLNSSHHLFTWRSTYENYSDEMELPGHLVYQLQYYQLGDLQNDPPQEIIRYSTNFVVASQKFARGTEYAAKVRSGPDKSQYWGEWSAWSSEVRWRTEWLEEGLTSTYELAKVFVPVCILAPLLLVCTVFVKMWRKAAFVPTPALYFHTLYSDCQGDFKSWVVAREKPAEAQQAEEILTLDTVLRCPEVPQQERCTRDQQRCTDGGGGGYSNLVSPGSEGWLLGFPYAVRTMAPPPEGALTFSSPPGSADKEDPRYYPMTGGAPLYCNEYCTLSAFHQSHGDAAAENFGRFGDKVAEDQA